MASNSSLQISGSPSSPLKRMRKSAGPSTRSEESYVPFSEMSEGGAFTTTAMVCRRWEASNTAGKYISTEYVLSDNTGGAIHCIVRSTIAHCFVSKLEVGQVYSFSRFTVHPNKESYRLRNSDAHLIQLEGNSVVRKLECPTTGFVRYPVQLVDIEAIGLNGSRFLIDVIGKVVNIGRAKPTRNGSQFLEFELMNERGRTIKVTLWGALCDDLLRRIRGAPEMFILLLPAMNIKEYRGDIFLSSTSATCIYDSMEIPEISHLSQLMEGVVAPAANSDGTLLQLLQLGRERKGLNRKTSVTLHCTVRVVGVREQNSWHYNSCGAPNCRKGLKPVEDSFWCESCDKICEFPVSRFRLELEVADPIATLHVTVFDEMAEVIVKKSATALLEQIWAHLDANDNEIPHEVLQLVGTNHVLELKSHTYYDHGSYESFTVSRIIKTLEHLPVQVESNNNASPTVEVPLENDPEKSEVTDAGTSHGCLNNKGPGSPQTDSITAAVLERVDPPIGDEITGGANDTTSETTTPVKVASKKKLFDFSSPKDE